MILFIYLLQIHHVYAFILRNLFDIFYYMYTNELDSEGKSGFWMVIFRLVKLLCIQRIVLVNCCIKISWFFNIFFQQVKVNNLSNFMKTKHVLRAKSIGQSFGYPLIMSEVVSWVYFLIIILLQNKRKQKHFLLKGPWLTLRRSVNTMTFITSSDKAMTIVKINNFVELI